MPRIKGGTLLRLDQIRIDGGTQPRVAIDEQVVAEYAELYSTGADLPPVTVFFDGETYWLADGYHRFWANRRIDCEYVLAAVRHGTQRDAILYSVGANAGHGLRRTNADKRKAVLTLLENPKVSHDDKGRPWSNMDVARRCRVHEKTVRRIREDHTSALPKYESPECTFIHPKSRKPARMKTAKIGRSRKARKGKAPRIAKGAFQPQQLHGENGPVPMRAISLPLNNPRQAARSMLSLYGEPYMREFAAELSHLLEIPKGEHHACTDQCA